MLNCSQPANLSQLTISVYCVKPNAASEQNLHFFAVLFVFVRCVTQWVADKYVELLRHFS